MDLLRASAPAAIEIMRSPLPTLRSVAPAVPLAALLLVLLCSLPASAQDDSPSLGDVARKLRHDKLQQQSQPQPDSSRPVPVSTEPTLPVIDNDNLAQVMEDARKARPVKQDKTVFSMDPSGKTLKLSSPDVTCSLSFNASASSVLIRPVLVEDLPLAELLKLRAAMNEPPLPGSGPNIRFARLPSSRVVSLFMLNPEPFQSRALR